MTADCLSYNVSGRTSTVEDKISNCDIVWEVKIYEVESKIPGIGQLHMIKK